MQKLATENIDMNDWFSKHAPEGLDQGNIEPAYQELTRRSAEIANEAKREKQNKALRDGLYKGAINLPAAIKAAKGDQDLIDDFTATDVARKERVVLDRRLKEALLSQRQAVTSALSPERKVAIKQIEGRIAEIDDRIKLIQSYTANPLDYFIGQRLAGEEMTMAEAIAKLGQEAEGLIRQKADLEETGYGEAGGIGRSPATPGQKGGRIDPAEQEAFLADNPEFKALLDKYPGTKINLPKGVGPQPIPKATDQENARRKKLGLPPKE
jgi:hypothetical protein